MKRSAALVPLSRDHHHALDAALRLRRAEPGATDAPVGHFLAFWEQHGRRHFEIEEQLLLPALPEDDDPAWREAVLRVRADHARIREHAARLASGASGEPLELAHTLGAELTEHVRFEERTLFVLLEEALDDEALAALGRAVDAAEAG